MADPITTEAKLAAALAKVKDLEAKLKTAGETAKTTLEAASKTFEAAFDTMSKTFQGVDEYLENAKSGYKEVSNQIKDLDKNGTRINSILTQSFNNLGDNLAKNLKKTSMAFQLVGMALASPQDFNSFAKNSEAAFISAGAQAQDFSDKLSKVNTIFSKMGIGLPSGLTQFFSAISQRITATLQAGENLKTGFLSTLATTGKLDQIFATGELDNVQARMSAFYAKIADAGAGAGRTLSQSMDFMSAFRELPGIFDAAASGLEGYADGAQLSTIAMRVATGTMQSNTKVAEFVKKSYEDIATTSGKMTDEKAYQRGLEMLALTQKAAGAVGVNFNTAEAYIKETANSFGMMGDNTEASLRTLGRFNDSLRSTGLTAKQSIDLISTMNKSISALTQTSNIGARALMSFRTGGPGGLQGAFQIENMIRQGRSDEVLQMAMRSLRQQFGGRIRTLQEAGTSQEASADFLRQRQMLMSGAFGGLVKDEAQANRLMEAMAKGQIDKSTLEQITGGAALKDAADKGNEIQASSLTELQKFNITSEKMLMFQEISAYNSTMALASRGQAENRSFMSGATRSPVVGNKLDENAVNIEIARYTGLVSSFATGIMDNVKNSGFLGLLDESSKLPPSAKNRELGTTAGSAPVAARNRGTTAPEPAKEISFKHEIVVKLEDGKVIGVVNTSNNGVASR